MSDLNDKVRMIRYRGSREYLRYVERAGSEERFRERTWLHDDGFSLRYYHLSNRVTLLSNANPTKIESTVYFAQLKFSKSSNNSLSRFYFLKCIPKNANLHKKKSAV